MTKIWLVEDDDTIRECLTTLLSLEGFRVFPFAEGEIALKRASDDPLSYWPELVFLDLYTEAMSASEFVQGLNALAVRLKQRMPRICVISGAADIERISRSLNADSFFQKPFEITEIIQYAKEGELPVRMLG